MTNNNIESHGTNEKYSKSYNKEKNLEERELLYKQLKELISDIKN
jgi:hypothetical protein